MILPVQRRDSGFVVAVVVMTIRHTNKTAQDLFFLNFGVALLKIKDSIIIRKNGFLSLLIDYQLYLTELSSEKQKDKKIFTQVI